MNPVDPDLLSKLETLSDDDLAELLEFLEAASAPTADTTSLVNALKATARQHRLANKKQAQ